MRDLTACQSTFPSLVRAFCPTVTSDASGMFYGLMATRSAQPQTVTDAVEAFLKSRELDEHGAALAAVARALAQSLDRVTVSDSARGLSAAPPISRRLVEVLDAIHTAETDDVSAQLVDVTSRLRRVS